MNQHKIVIAYLKKYRDPSCTYPRIGDAVGVSIKTIQYIANKARHRPLYDTIMNIIRWAETNDPAGIAKAVKSVKGW